MTLVLVSTGMKLVSPFQRGTMCQCKCPGTPAPGLSSGEAIQAMERLAADLPPGFHYAWAGLSLEEIRIEQGSGLAEHPLSEVTQRDKLNVVVIGIQHAQGSMEFNPVGNTVLHSGDHLIVLGSAETLKELERAAK